MLDPILELHNSNGALIVANDNWKETQQAAIAATLPASSYTAIVRGKNNTIGVGLVEVYELP